jgi:hypothetical protein
MPKRIVWDSNGRDGRWVGDDDVIEDGGRVHVPMILMDSKRRDRVQLVDTFKVDDANLDLHRPGYRVLGDKTAVAHNNIRSSARAEMIDRATNSWRMDARKRKPEPDDPDEDNNGNDDEQDARSKDARSFARRSPEGSRSWGPNQENNSHQGSQAQGYDARLDGERFRLDDIRRPAIEAWADYVMKRAPAAFPGRMRGLL